MSLDLSPKRVSSFFKIPRFFRFLFFKIILNNIFFLQHKEYYVDLFWKLLPLFEFGIFCIFLKKKSNIFSIFCLCSSYFFLEHITVFKKQ